MKYGIELVIVEGNGELQRTMMTVNDFPFQTDDIEIADKMKSVMQDWVDENVGPEEPATVIVEVVQVKEVA